MVVRSFTVVSLRGRSRTSRLAIGLSSPSGVFRLIASITVAAICGSGVNAEDGPSPPPFQPAEISIGEPLALPTTPPAALVPLQPIRPAPSSLPVGAVVPGTGWIGLTVDDAVVTGRLVVVDVAANGPAASSGIRVQDQLLAINGMPLGSADQLAAALAAIAPGSDVKVAIGRSDRIEEIELKAVARPPVRPMVAEWQPAAAVPQPIEQPSQAAVRPVQPAQQPALMTPAGAGAATPAPLAPPESGRGRTALGVRTLPVDPAVQARFRLAEPAGALVIGVVHDLPASKAGIPPGSVIVALGERPVRSPGDLTQVVTSSPVGRPMTLQYILPGGETRRAEVSLQAIEVPLERALVGPEP